jgi:hypothetical protein
MDYIKSFLFKNEWHSGQAKKIGTFGTFGTFGTGQKKAKKMGKTLDRGIENR